MPKFIQKIVDALLLTILSCVIIGSGILFLVSFLLSGKYLLEFNWPKFFEFFQAVILCPFVAYASFYIGAFYRSKTKNQYDAKDKTWFDGFIKK
jgi:hypothetical protein